MNLKRIYIICVIILIISTMTVVSAAENSADDSLINEDNDLISNYDPNITVPSKIWEYGENEITIDTDVQSYVNISGAISYSDEIQPGKTSIPLNMSAGKHNIIIDYSSNITSLQKDYNITVLRDNPHWDMQFHFLSGEVNNLDMDFHEITLNELRIMNLPEELTGNFSFYCNGKLWGEFEAQSYICYDIQDLYEGVYNFTLTYWGDDYFYPVSKSEILTIQPITFNIPDTVELGYNDKIKVECSDYMEGILTIYIDGKLVKKENINTKDKFDGKTYYTYDLSNLKGNKTYNIEINYVDNEFRNITKKASVNVTGTIKNYIKFTKYSQYIYGKTYNYVWFSAPDDLENKLNITVNGKKYEYSLNSQGLYAVNIGDVDPGIQTIIIEYPGDSKYCQNSFNTTFEVAVEAEETYFYVPPNETVNFTATLPDDCNGNLTLEIKKHGSNQYEFYKTVEVKNGNVNIPITMSHIGSYSFKTKFTGNYQINRLIFEIEIYSLGRYSLSQYTKQNSEHYLTLTLPDDAYGYLTVEILSNGSYKTYKNAEIKNGKADVSLPTDHIGKYFIKAYSSGNYETYNLTTEYTVEPLYSINLKEDYAEYNSTYEITLELPNDGTGNLTLMIENITSKTVELSDGKASISFPTDHVGKYTYHVYYDGNYELYNRTNESIMICPIYSYSNNIVSINGDLNSEGTLYIKSYNFNEHAYDNIAIVNVSNGKALFDMTELLEEIEDRKSAEIEYISKNNESAYWYETFNPINPDIKITARDLTVYYNDVATFKAIIYKNNQILKGTSNASIRIESKTYAANVINGVLSKQIKLTPGTYKVKITYKKASVSKKITVKHIVTLKTVKVKKSSKKLILQATLKNKNPIKNKQVTFKFNGKTYKAKTNSKGIAKVTVKANVLKKLKVGKKITYQATYGKDTVKKTVKVQK